MPQGNITAYLEQKVLDHVLRGIAYTSPGDVYVGIVTSLASDADLEQNTVTNEVTGYDGDRKVVNFSVPSYEDEDETNPAEVENENLLEFESMPADETIAYAIVCESATPGTADVLYWCPLVSNKTVNEGDTFQLPIGDLICDLD